ncbi:MAG: acetylornithine deacetylase [Pseudomonadota bacterium]
MERVDRISAILGDLIAFPTVSSDSNLELTDYAADLLRQAGAEVDVTKDATGLKANLFATFGPPDDGGLVLSGHTDVVPVEGQDWSSYPFEMVREGDRLFGRGACDMKGFVACVLSMAPEFGKWPLKTPIHVALTYDEEVGCYGAQALAGDLNRRGVAPAMAIIGEPTLMRVIDGHKGCYEYTTEFQGLAGHGSTPDLGVNAAAYAALYAGRLLELAEELKERAPSDCPFDPPWTTINIGRIEGGSAHNVIPAQAALDWEMRPVTADDAHFVRAEIDQYADAALAPQMQRVSRDASVNRRVIGEVDGLMPTPNNKAAELVARITGSNARETVAFGTEAGIFQGLDMHCVVCGPGSIEQAHKADEFIALSQLAACDELLRGLEGVLT